MEHNTTIKLINKSLKKVGYQKPNIILVSEL